MKNTIIPGGKSKWVRGGASAATPARATGISVSEEGDALAPLQLKIHQNNTGFTLVELASVLGIIAVIIGMTVSSGVTMINSTKVTATQQKMAAIDQALMAFRMANNRIPCPASLIITPGSANYGVEAANPGIGNTTSTPVIPGGCTGGTPAANYTSQNSNTTAIAVAEGGVPTVTLGLPNEFMYDGWGNRFTYAVDVSMTMPVGAFTGVPIGAVCGAITIQGDPTPATPSAYGGIHNYTRSSGAIYTLISHGPNGHGAYTASGKVVNANSSNLDELENCHCSSSGVVSSTLTPTYVQEQPYTYNPANPLYNFDDIVTYKERWQMAAPWDVPGVTCPAMYTYTSNNFKYIKKYDIQGNYLAQLISVGSASGDINGTGGIAFDSYGNMWIPDQVNNRVEEFSSSASFLNGYGCGYTNTTSETGCSPSNAIGNYGTGSGEFSWPDAIAIDSSGNIWVVDNGNNRVEKFDNNMNFLLGIGCGYPSAAATGATTCTNGTLTADTIGYYGSGTGEFNSPDDITIDPAGNVWVVDSLNNRLQKFDSNGNFLLGIGCGYTSAAATGATTCTNGTLTADTIGYYGAGTGEFHQPEYMAIDSAGNIWVTDNNWSGLNNRVEEFSGAGIYISQFTITSPEGIAFDPSGNLWIGNDSNVVQKCTPSGSCTALSSSSGDGLKVISAR